MTSIQKEIEDAAVITFLAMAIDKTNTMNQHIDDQTNIMVGVGTAVFVFATARFGSTDNKLAFGILGVFAATSALVGLFALHPPRFMRKKGQDESLIFPTHIAATQNVESYIAAIHKVVQKQSLVVEQCSRELYNMSRYYYLPKRWLYRCSRNFLLAGVALALISFIIGLK